MPSPFTLGLEDSFESSWSAFGTYATVNGAQIRIILDDFTASSEVSSRGGRATTLGATVIMLTSEWVGNSMKKGVQVTLENGKKGRVADDPYVPSEGRGTVEFSLTDL